MAELEFQRKAVDAFEFQLAMALGMTVAEMRERVSQAEFVQWRGFFRYMGKQK